MIEINTSLDSRERTRPSPRALCARPLKDVFSTHPSRFSYNSIRSFDEEYLFLPVSIEFRVRTSVESEERNNGRLRVLIDPVRSK